MDRNLCRVFVASLLLASSLLWARPAFAGIYCTSQEVIRPSQGMTCRATCVFCIIQETGEEIARDCYDNVCWFGGFREN
jgi:hypothetical protein